MRKLGLLVVVIAALALVPAICSALPISGSPHDLSGRGWGTNQICIFCHTPHNAAAIQIAPLWNHASTAMAAFTLYSSPSLNAVPGQPSGNARACLSCHDGTVALDSYGTRVGTNFVSGTALLGTDLSNDHPISFTYDAALATADGGLVSPASAISVVPGIPLFASQLQCASCHGVHDNANGDYLRNTNAGSALCLKCHNK
jgi:predicted CXXCH cytochrome family protein